MTLWLVKVLRRIFGPLIGVSFALIVFGTSIFGNYIVTLFLPMIAVLNRHERWREMMDRAITFWMVIPLFFLEYVYGVRVRASGDRIDVNRPAIIIMNHRTRLDWLYFWLALWRINPWLMTTNKIALKELLKHVPGAGFGMQASQYIFLRRDVDVDLKRMSRAVDYYSAMGRPYQLLMFPEGTDKTEHTTRRSAEYARKAGLHAFRHLLHPRMAGFIHLVKQMKKRDYLSCIYDVTVAYPMEIVQNETDMILWGRLSTNVHYDIRRIGVEEIPLDSDAELSKWLLDLWEKKDEKLERFYAQTNHAKRRLEASGERNLWLKDDCRQSFVKIFGFFFWISVVCVWLYHLQFLLMVQIGFLFLILNYFYIYGRYGGIDNLILSRWESFRSTNLLSQSLHV